MSASPAQTPAPAPAPAPATSATTSTGGRFGGRNARSGRRNGNQDNNNSNRFVPKLTSIKILVSNSENKGQDFTKFQKSIHHHALTTFKNSKDVSKAILEFVDPYVELRQNQPNLSTIRNENNLQPEPPVSGEEADDKFARETENADKREMAKMLYSSQVKMNAKRGRDLTQNLTILWATIMGQCSPALQEEVKGHPDYILKSADFSSIWLLESLQKITAGVNKTTNKYFFCFQGDQEVLSHSTGSYQK